MAATPSSESCKEAGIEPAPERGEKTQWKTFLKAHWEALAAADFFTVEVLDLRGLFRFHVLFVIKLSTPASEDLGGTGPIKCRERQGGVLKYYYRDAA